jgi:uncharacterized RmlC-like cupin family protein
MTSECVLVRAGQAAEGITGVTYAAGVSAATAGASGLCLELASLPPARARGLTSTTNTSQRRTWSRAR